MRSLLRHSILLWLIAPLCLWLAIDRPRGAERRRAAELPQTLGPYAMVAESPITDELAEALGTRDAVLRTYRAPQGQVFVYVVYHGANWKSVHAPDTCLRGDDMTLVEDGTATLALAAERFELGRLRLFSRRYRLEYLSQYAYLAPPRFATGSYLEFFLHHAPRALLRQDLTGALIRVETWVAEDGVAAADERCRAALQALVPAVFEQLR